jgi:seryl-tRNA synthetase
MLDLKLIREQPERVRAAAEAKGDHADVDLILSLDEERRTLIASGDELRAKRNEASEEIGRAKREGRDATDAISEMKQVAASIKEIEEHSREVEEKLRELMLRVPNLPADIVPLGSDSSDNVILKEWGETPVFDFEPRDHVELGRVSGMLDFERSAKMSGAGFCVYVGDGARLERALWTFFLDQARQAGYTEVSTPFIVGRDAMIGTGQLPKLEDDMYACPTDDLFLIPTAEVPITNLHAGEILPPDALPLRYTGYSPCFRREAGSYGKETRGLLRVHQFHKVELVQIVEPDKSEEALEEITAQAEACLEKLGLKYRRALLCAGDLSFSAHKCYDLEVFSPAENAWLEVSSCSNFTDFQARRMNLRYRPKGGGRPVYPHTLNGSALATSRLTVALIETYQTERATVRVPEALRPYLGDLPELGTNARGG